MILSFQLIFKKIKLCFSDKIMPFPFYKQHDKHYHQSQYLTVTWSAVW